MSSVASSVDRKVSVLRSPGRWRLQTKLIAIFVALLLLVQCLALLTYFVARGESRRTEAANALAVARTASAVVDGFVKSVEVAVLVEARALGAFPSAIEQGTVNANLATLESAFEGTLRTVFITDLNGRVVATPTGQQIGTELGDRPFVQALQSGADSVWTGGMPGLESGTITVVHGRVIRGPDQTPQGFLFAAMYPEDVMRLLPISLPEDGALTIIDHRGFVLYASDRPDLALDQRDVSGAPGVQEALSGSIFRIDGIASPFASSERFGALVPIGRNGWVVSFTRSEAAIDAALDNRFRQQVAGYTLVMFVAVALAVGIARRITLPLSRLAESAAAIARGERPRIVVPTADEEVRVLAETIETMAAAVADREENARFLAEASRLLASSLDFEVTVRNVARLVVPRIADWCVVYTLEQADGDTASQPIRAIAVTHVDPHKIDIATEIGRRYPTQPNPSAVLVEPLRTGRSKVYPEITDSWLASLAHDEEHLHLLRALGLTSAMVVPLIARGRTLGALVLVSAESGRHYREDDLDVAEDLANRIALAIDIARLFQQIRDLNRSLEQRARDLAAANSELEAFSYSVSHDLRAPLRAVDGFARILLEDHATELSPEARRYLHTIATSANHMGALIDDLLTFSRLGRHPLKKQVVAPASLVRKALEDLEPETQGRRIELLIGELPECEADPSLLRLVFANLLSNALKFTRQREVAVVEIGARIESGERIYFVRDNGVGFDMRYAHKLFGVFQRLHRAEEYEGTGVGLAIVQRIVHRHGGRVWAEATPDRGATFSFTL